MKTSGNRLFSKNDQRLLLRPVFMNHGCQDHVGSLNFCWPIFLSMSSSEARTSRDFFSFFLSPDFHELWHSVMTTSLITEVKQQWAALVLQLTCLSVLLVSMMALRLSLVDQNPFQLCLSRTKIMCFFFQICLFCILNTSVEAAPLSFDGWAALID